MIQANRFSAAIMAILCLALFTACSGSGDSGNNTNPRIGLSPLVLPEQVSVVDPQSSTTTKPAAAESGTIRPLLIGAVFSDLSATSDYVNDRVSVYVNERSLESFQSINEILCMISQTRYDEMLNRGPYRTQVDKNLCSSKRSDASSASQSSSDQSSGADSPQYEEWIVDSSRLNSQSPHIVKVWVHSQPDNPNEPEQLIYAKIVITEGADTAPPYGIFTTNFKAFLPPDLSTIMFKGFLNAERDADTGEILLKFSTEDKDSYSIEKATLYKDTVTKTGAGSVLKAQTYPWEPYSITRFNLAYDANYFLRTEPTVTSICLDRTSYDVSTWKYGLYTTTSPTGKRIKVNSGFSVNIGNTYGWVGYYGAWFPDNVTIHDGDWVNKHDYATNTDTPFMLVRPGGKLKKHTKHLTSLGGIKSIPMVWWDVYGNMFLVAWDSPSKSLIKVAQGGSNGAWQTITPTAIDLKALPWVEMGFWSQALGGMVVVKFPPPVNYGDPPDASHCGYNGGAIPETPYDCEAVATAINDAIQVLFYSEDIVYADDATVPSTLACFDNCPDAANLATATPFYAISSQQSVTPALSTYASYSFSTATMLLTDSSATGAAVVTSTTVTAFQNGITSGPLFDPAFLTAPSPSIPSPLGCDWDPFNQTCGGKAWTVLPVFYTWETGPNEWNQYTGLKDAGGNPVKFDPPIQVEYVHSQPSTTAPDHKYDGTTFYLEYAGFGDLQGIPGKCVDIDKGVDADCNDGAINKAIRWVPEFNIPAADAGGNLTEVTDLLHPSKTYFVKPLEGEERMKQAPGACTGLTVSDYTLPSMSSWINPNIGPEPTVNEAPAVIGGVVQ